MGIKNEARLKDRESCRCREMGPSLWIPVDASFQQRSSDAA